MQQNEGQTVQAMCIWCKEQTTTVRGLNFCCAVMVADGDTAVGFEGLVVVTVLTFVQ
jgi:hypothetical protein